MTLTHRTAEVVEASPEEPEITRSKICPVRFLVSHELVKIHSHSPLGDVVPTGRPLGTIAEDGSCSGREREGRGTK